MAPTEEIRLKPKLGITDDGTRRGGNATKVEAEPLRVEELDRAEKTILRLIQSRAFPKEMGALQKIQRAYSKDDRQFAKAKKSEIRKSSTLFRLDPFLDKDGLIHIGGRLGNSQEFEESFKHPVILPKKSFIVEVIIRDAHAGRGITLNELRSRYWIVSANSAVRHLISKCVVCRRLRGTTGEQKMADLLEERITSAPPFTYCASRGVHIETADSLETDSFMNALRRFIARRGPVCEIRSDQGTNTVGAQTELKKALEEMEHDDIQRRLSKDFNSDWVIKWKRNPPAVSHMGGVWERQIRSV
ncbi:uncharacterized protein [Porites lutea]|uniref:uncharacterized protein n=1 Tax=Porites lutea TaxID=51062 RepID=UPI003CC64082